MRLAGRGRRRDTDAEAGTDVGDGAEFTQLQATTMRPYIALAANVLLPAAAGSSQVLYRLHPRLINLQRLYNQQKAAMIFNVGTLVQPTAKANLNSATLPRNLYLHSDQTSQCQRANPTIAGGSGWGGRMADLLAGANSVTEPAAVLQSLDAGFMTFDTGMQMIGAASVTTNREVRGAQEIDAALNS